MSRSDSASLTEASPTTVDKASFHDVLANRSFRALWIAQITSQLAQNLTWITLGAFVAKQTGKATLVSVTTISALMAPLLFSAFAGVLVDRSSKRGVLLGSNLLRILLTLFFIISLGLNVAVQTTVIVVLIFIANVVSQFFAPAEAATIPLVVERRNLIVASSLFNITFNICQLLPVTLGLLLFDVMGIGPLLLIVGALYVIAALLVAALPAGTAQGSASFKGHSWAEIKRYFVGDVREALGFLSSHPDLRLILFQINVAPTFVFVFLPLGLIFVPQTFGLDPKRAWILLLPAGIGLMLGAVIVARLTARIRKEALINGGLVAMGVAISMLGMLAVVVRFFMQSGSHLPKTHGGFHNQDLIVPAMVLSLIIGLAMALSSIPAQTLVFERTTEDVRGRVLSIQLLVGAALPLLPLLTVGTLADIFGTATVMLGLGVIIVLIGLFSIRLDRLLA